jgi:hypothetical protein
MSGAAGVSGSGGASGSACLAMRRRGIDGGGSFFVTAVLPIMLLAP